MHERTKRTRRTLANICSFINNLTQTNEHPLKMGGCSFVFLWAREHFVRDEMFGSARAFPALGGD